MACSRREFLRSAGAAGAGMALAHAAGAQTRAATLDPEALRHWIAPLPRLERAQPTAGGAYQMTMQEAFVRLHPHLPPTRVWTYNGAFPAPLLEAESGKAVTIRWRNRLPPRHFLPVDPTLAGKGSTARTVAHVHGARVPAASDGYPENWIVPGQEQTFTYPNPQEAAPLFYHDHAMGTSRLNVYAGMLGPYWIRDAAERALRLPDGEHELPLLLCDRWLDPHGQLYYPTSGLAGHPWVPEVFGNCMLVNGALWPHLALQPTVYRLRVCNAANSRFFSLSFSERLPLYVIGSDQGLLQAPVEQNALLLAPAERADVLVNFRPAAGHDFYLLNDEQPMLQCRVASTPGPGRTHWRPPARLRPLVRTDPSTVRRSRLLTLDEFDGYHGLPKLMLLNSTRWSAPPTETPTLGDTETWEFVNLSMDSHPIHLHQVRFQILDRRAFDSDQYLLDQTLRYLAPAHPPAADERGWKDTVRCPAGEVTRIIVRFESYAGRYVWHCHILEHQANLMMRPLEILPPTERKGT